MTRLEVAALCPPRLSSGGHSVTWVPDPPLRPWLSPHCCVLHGGWSPEAGLGSREKTQHKQTCALCPHGPGLVSNMGVLRGMEAGPFLLSPGSEAPSEKGLSTIGVTVTQSPNLSREMRLLTRLQGETTAQAGLCRGSPIPGPGPARRGSDMLRAVDVCCDASIVPGPVESLMFPRSLPGLQAVSQSQTPGPVKADYIHYGEVTLPCSEALLSLGAWLSVEELWVFLLCLGSGSWSKERFWGGATVSRGPLTSFLWAVDGGGMPGAP